MSTAKNAVKKQTTAKSNGKPSELAQKAVSSKVSVEEKIQKVQELGGLTAKRARTVETLNKLRQFQFSSGDSSRLKIIENGGSSFETSNSNLIEMLSSNLQEILNQKIKELDAMILAFEV